MLLPSIKRSRVKAGLLLVLCTTSFAHATTGEVQPVASIRAAAEQLVLKSAHAGAGKVFATADKLDSRLRLAVCGVALSAFLPSGANLGPRATVGVRCTQGQQWTVYVPVAIETETPVLILTRAISRGAPLSASDVEVQPRRLRGLATDYLTHPDQLKQQHLKRSLPAGTILSPNVLMPDVLVKRGQQVVLLATVGGIEVRANGVALTDGSASGRVRVQNATSLKVVEGTVDKEGVVRVQL